MGGDIVGEIESLQGMGMKLVGEVNVAEATVAEI